MDCVRNWKYWLVSKIWVLLVINLLPGASGLYEDQIGKFDWRKQFVGRVEHVYFNSANRRIYVGTDQNVIAALNLRTGATVWRQIFESGPLGQIDFLQGWKDELFIISGNGKYLRNWDMSNGFLYWELPIIIPNPENVLRNYFQLNPKEEQLTIATVTEDTHVQISVLNFSTGSAAWSQSFAAPWGSHSTSCQFVDDSFICIDNEALILYSIKTDPDSKFKATLIPNFQRKTVNYKNNIISFSQLDGENNPFFGLNVDKTHTLLARIEGEQIKFLADFDDVLDLTVINSNEEFLLFTTREKYGKSVIEINEGVNFNTTRTEVVTDIPSQFYGLPDKMWVSEFLRKEGEPSYRILFTTQDDALMLYQMNGKNLWSREEALASVVNVEMIDLPMSESDVQFEQEFRLDDANLLTMVLKRLTSQVFQLENLLLSIIRGLYQRGKFMTSHTPSTLTRDVFNINKIVVVITQSGKLFGIDSTNGKVIWQYYLPNLSPFAANGRRHFYLYSQTKTTHFSQTPQCAVIGMDKNTKNGILYQFHSLTGEAINLGLKKFDFQISQVMLLPPPEDDYLRGILLLDSTGHVHIYPESAMESALELLPSLFLYTANTNEGTVTGYSLYKNDDDQILVTPVWNIKLSSNHLITEVVVKLQNEHVHSQGRVMGDRSVMYKYLNPNLVGIITIGTDAQLKPFFKIILVDVITGNIIFSAVHKRCRGPVHAVLSENWAVYAYYNEKARRTEMTVLELYEGKVQSNTTAFSSLNPPQLPMVERQAYLFPPGLSAMAVTITEKGITSKHLLFALPNGGIVELPKSVLDPRRSVFPTPEHKEDGIYPYVPELPVPAESVINYNQSVYNIRGISTAPAGLESTCLVFAYGLDLFFARVTPSRTFDVLKDDFDHFLISVVLISLILGAYLIKQLSSRKALHQAWK